MRSKRTRERDGNNGKHHPHPQLTIVAAVAGKTAAPELAYRATPENTKRHNLLPIVSRDGRMPTNHLLTDDIFDKLRQRHSTYELGIATLELEIINISSAATESKRIVCNLPFEKRTCYYQWVILSIISRNYLNYTKRCFFFQ